MSKKRNKKLERAAIEAGALAGAFVRGICGGQLPDNCTIVLKDAAGNKIERTIGEIKAMRGEN